MISSDQIKANLQSTSLAIQNLTRGYQKEDAAWRPAPGKWSLVEVVGHLLDEERLDFRARISSLLENPNREWDPIDPEKWVVVRNYQEQDLEQTLETLAEERARSLEMIEAWRRVDWSVSRVHPQLGELSAGDLLWSWATHDLLHIRQILKIRYGLIQRDSRFSSDYAGPW